MAKGTYERTPLVQARFQLTITQRKINTLLGKVAEAQHQKDQLEAEIARLEAEEAAK